MLKVILLGTGDPSPSPLRTGASQVIVVDQELLLVDCGPGATYQMLKAGIDPRRIKKLFLTHLHWDHTTDLPHFALSTWTFRREGDLQVFGPGGTAEMIEALISRAFRIDIESRVKGVKGRKPIRVEVTEVKDGIVDETDQWKVTALEVDHWQSLFPEIQSNAYAYRVDSVEGSIVISGDTRACPSMVNLASGADILVHECTYTDHEREHAAKIGRPPLWHITSSELGMVAREAGVKRLVVSHLSPHRHKESLEEMRKDIAASFKGEIIFGEDLQEICVTMHGF
jgi:ribonuclease BN (tRNA processing enzyme)